MQAFLAPLPDFVSEKLDLIAKSFHWLALKVHKGLVCQFR